MATVFIVEDDLVITKLYKEILEIAGFNTFCANNGERAVEIFRTILKKPDIILMDHRMPIKNGLDASKEILEIGKNSKIIFVSADPMVKTEALALGAIKFIKKPFSIKDLVLIINNILNLSKMNATKNLELIQNPKFKELNYT